ncbi:MAG: sugar phosphate nucleotidyltransferase [Candidatus Aenigmatarchaeota archaeon]
MQAIVLAAGESSRFWPLNTRHKSLIKICGKPIIQYTIEKLIKSGIEEIIIVQNKRRDVEEELRKSSLIKLIEKGKINFVEQELRLGMGNALLCAKPIIKKNSFLVLNPERIDCDEFIPEIIKKGKKAKCVIAGSITKEPWLYGIMKLDHDRVLSLVEKPKESDSNIKAIGIYLLPYEYFEEYERIKKHHYDFEDALQSLIERYDVRAVVKEQETISLKYPWHLFEFSKVILDSIFIESYEKSNKANKQKEEKQNIDRSAKLCENVHIEGNVFIGKNTKIYENATVRGPCYIGDNCIIGNNALIREYCIIENNCTIGANSELARSILQEQVSIHSGFVGDSIIGRNTSIGAGIITANKRLDRNEIYAIVKGEKVNTKLTSLGAIIGENVKIGIRAGIMPGAMIGNNAIIGPNSLIKGVIKDNEVINI